VMMPGATGIDLCRTIKSDPVLRHTPVILLTARSGSDATLEGYAVGADDFVSKPFHTQVLRARVTAQLKLRFLSLQLAAQGRLMTATTLAAGIAHEIRNPLNAIINGVMVIQQSNEEPLPASSEKLLQVVADGGRRILDIVSALDSHVRPSEGSGIVSCEVQVGIDSTLRLLGHRLESIAVHRLYESKRPILAPPGEFNMVFVNLIDNAIKANPSNIYATVRDVSDSVRIEISDDGPGISHAVAQRIFDPFFTTRPVGDGTGLGLYLCQRIVRSRGGDLRYESRPGGGATFIVDVPAEDSPRAARPHVSDHRWTT
jgi:signal transduction histidine kinase